MPVTGYMSYTDLFTTLSVLSKQRTYDADGGWSDVWTATGVEIRGVIADATTRDLMLAQQKQYLITHSIVAEGAPAAAIGQRFVASDLSSGETAPTGAKVFQIQAVENAAELGAYTIYQTEEVK